MAPRLAQGQSLIWSHCIMSSRKLSTAVPFLTLVAATAALGVSATAHADHGARYRPVSHATPVVARHNPRFDYAPVEQVEPLVRYVTVKTPVRECWTETEYVEVQPRRRGNGGAALVGAIIGGVVGNQFGSGRGNDAATVAGSLIGAAVGADAGRRNGRRAEVYAQPVERCATTMQEHQEERIDGYRVTYRYNGQRFVTEMPYDPGREIRVRVDVRPAG